MRTFALIAGILYGIYLTMNITSVGIIWQTDVPLALKYLGCFVALQGLAAIGVYRL